MFVYGRAQASLRVLGDRRRILEIDLSGEITHESVAGLGRQFIGMALSVPAFIVDFSRASIEIQDVVRPMDHQLDIGADDRVGVLVGRDDQMPMLQAYADSMTCHGRVRLAMRESQRDLAINWLCRQPSAR